MHRITKTITVGCTHGTVRVKLTKSLKNKVADILHSSKKKIKVQYLNIQMTVDYLLLPMLVNFALVDTQQL